VKARPSFEKRRKEMQRQERNKDKAERRKTRRDERVQKPDSEAAGVDPDIAHIVWGPQPPSDTEAAPSGGASANEGTSNARGSRKGGGEAVSSKDGIGVSGVSKQ
jgi:hypothetical protein